MTRFQKQRSDQYKIYKVEHRGKYRNALKRHVEGNHCVHLVTGVPECGRGNRRNKDYIEKKIANCIILFTFFCL
jgi:hypothetical protein